MAWPPVDELVTGWVERSYLKKYGWWLNSVLDQFAFLEPLGYSLPSGADNGVAFHQKGNNVWFRGPGRDVVINYDPESRPPFIWAELVDGDLAAGGRLISLDTLLAASGIAESPPSRSPLDRNAIEATIGWWAKGIHGDPAELLALPASRDIQQP